MAVQSAQLLKQLEPAVRPGLAPLSAPSRRTLESCSFDQLLQMAANGGIHSGRQIDVKCESSAPLSASQLERMAAAADQAEAAGFKRALLLIDGRGFVLDVATRSLVAELANGAAGSVHAIDGAIHVASNDETPFELLHPPDAGLAPARLLEHLRAAQNPPADSLIADQLR